MGAGNGATIEGPNRGGRHLWLVQSIEYCLGFVTAATAINADRPLGPLIVATAIILNATFLRGPLSAFRVTKPRTHRLVGLMIAVGAMVVVITVPMATSAIAVIVFVAVAQGALSVRFGHGF